MLTRDSNSVRPFVCLSVTFQYCIEIIFRHYTFFSIREPHHSNSSFPNTKHLWEIPGVTPTKVLNTEGI